MLQIAMKSLVPQVSGAYLVVAVTASMESLLVTTLGPVEGHAQRKQLCWLRPKP